MCQYKDRVICLYLYSNKNISLFDLVYIKLRTECETERQRVRKIKKKTKKMKTFKNSYRRVWIDIWTLNGHNHA